MPVIVVGADTRPGMEIVERLLQPGREVRAFVTDSTVGETLRSRGVKVATGDVSDDSHIAGACLNCFSVVLIEEAARDGRDRAFVGDSQACLSAWASAAGEAGVRRAIWVTSGTPPEVKGAESAAVDPADPDLAERVYRLDEAASLSGPES